MELTLTTTYKNVDDEWIKWWLKTNAHNFGLESDNVEPGEEFQHSITSKDPTSNVIATTQIIYSTHEESAR